MTFGTRPGASTTMLGGTIDLPSHACAHGPARSVRPWAGQPGTAGTVTVVGAGKMGLPLAAQFASHGWHVIAVDVNEAVIASINDGRAHVAEEPGLAELVQDAHAAGRLRATADAAAAARESDVVILIVPVTLDEHQQPDHRHMDAAVRSIAAGVSAGMLVVFETTLPVRRHPGAVPADAGGGNRPPCRRRPVRRVLAGAPVLGGGLPQPVHLPEARRRHRTRVDRPSDAVLRLRGRCGGRCHELGRSRRAQQARRDDLPGPEHRLRERAGGLRRRAWAIDVLETIRAANSQPYSHIHQPGLGVGGHCIPVYPHFLLSRAPEMELVGLARRTNDDQVGPRCAAWGTSWAACVTFPCSPLG